MVKDVVAKGQGVVTSEQVQALATLLDRTPQTVREWVIEARNKFLGSASRYVEIHLDAVEKALAAGTDDSLDVARRGAEWAIERAGYDGQSIVEKQKSDTSGLKIMIGVKIGGLVDGVAVSELQAKSDHEA
jgi:hypothetical protein